MSEFIGKVKLNDTFYSGSDLYSDGDAIEEEMLRIAKSGKWEEELLKSNKWAVLYHFSDIRGNIVEWYPMEKEAEVLEIGSGCGAVSGVLCKKAKRVVGIELSKRRSLINAYRNSNCDNLEILVGNFKDIVLEEKFDYVTLIGVLEYASLYMDSDNPYEGMLMKIKKYLKPDGKIIIAIENKMGLKYLNGAKEDHVGKRFAGMEDYRYIDSVRTFSKPELEKMLEKCGMDRYSFYYPSPDYKLPDTVYSDECMPKRGDIRFWGTNYDSIRLCLYNDGIISDQVCADQMFEYFSNSFLVVANEAENKVKYAHYTRQREKEFQTSTIIYTSEGEKRVKKEYLCEKERKNNILENMEKYYPALQEQFQNVTYLPVKYRENGSIEYPYLTGETVEELLFKEIHRRDRLLDAFEKAFRHIFCIKKDKIIPFKLTEPYKAIFGDCMLEEGVPAVALSNLDMNFGNLMLCGGKLYCFDYEWIFDFPIPIDLMKLRCLNVFWSKYNMYYSARLKKDDVLQRIGIRKEEAVRLTEMDLKFQEFVYGSGYRSQYLKHYRKPCGMLECRGL